MDQFEETVRELFKEADVPVNNSTKADFDECVSILRIMMSNFSARTGLTWKRSRVYEDQKQALVEDLKAKYHA